MKKLVWSLGEKRLDLDYDENVATAVLSDRDGDISKVNLTSDGSLEGDGVLLQFIADKDVEGVEQFKRIIMNFAKSYSIADGVVVTQSQSSDNIIVDSMKEDFVEKLESENFTGMEICIDDDKVILGTDYLVNAVFDFSNNSYRIDHAGDLEEEGSFKNERDLEEVVRFLRMIYQDYRDIDVVMDSIVNLKRVSSLKRINDFISEMYSKEELLSKPPTYAKNKELWEECVIEATEDGEIKVPIVNPILLYKSKISDSDENHRNLFSKVLNQVFGDEAYLSWKSDGEGAVVYLGDLDIAEIHSPENTITKVEVWNYRYLDKISEFIKKVSKVFDSVEIVRITKANVRITDAVDTQLLKTIVDANLQHHGVQGYTLTTSGGTVRVKINNIVVATITDKSNSLEVDSAPQCPPEVVSALEEIKNKGADVVKEEDGSLKKSFKDIANKVYSTLKTFTKSVTSGMGKDAEQAVTSVLGPAGVIANSLVSTVAEMYKNRKSGKK